MATKTVFFIQTTDGKLAVSAIRSTGYEIGFNSRTCRKEWTRTRFAVAAMDKLRKLSPHGSKCLEIAHEEVSNDD